MDKKCLIFAAGEYFETAPRIDSGDYIIAADGGYDYLCALGIVPDIAVGDFDSAAAIPPDSITKRLAAEKDETDTAAAINLALEKGFKALHIYGGTGGRLDHTLANIQCLAGLTERGCTGFLYGEDTVITAVKNGSLSFPNGGRGIVSVFSHSDESTGVFETGLKYSLDNATLKNNVCLGISNELTDAPARISVESGTLIVMYPAGTEISIDSI